MKFELLAAQSLSRLNLVASVAGLLCRLRIEEPDHSLTPKMVEELTKCLQAIDPKNRRAMAPAGAGEKKASGQFLVWFLTQFMLQAQQAIGSDVQTIRISPAVDTIHVDIFVEFEIEEIVRRIGSYGLRLIDRTLAADAEISAAQITAEIETFMASLKKDYVARCPGASMQAFTMHADERNIPWRRLSQDLQYVQFGYGKHQQISKSSILSTEGHNAAELANNKEMTTRLLRLGGLPVARQIRVSTEQAALNAAKTIGYPVVLKPIAGMQGYGITPDIANDGALKRAFVRAQAYHRHYLVEKHIDGEDHRLLVIGGKYVGCVRRAISTIRGDGTRSINELVATLNQEAWRNQVGANQKYHVRKLDIITECLKDQGFDWTSVPPAGKTVKLHIVPNLSQGGTNTELRDDVHPENIKMAERAAKILGLKVCGVDYLTTDISKPYWETGGSICEVNVSPAIDVMFPSSPPDLARLFRQAFELVFPPNKDMSLPVFVCLGDEQVSLKIREFLQKKELLIGYCSKERAEIGGSPLVGLETPTAQAEAILWNGCVEAAIVQENVGDIRRFGLAYTQCSVLVVSAMPQIDGRPAPEVLAVLAKTVRGSILLNEADAALVRWAAGEGNPQIQLITTESSEIDVENFAKKALAAVRL